MESIPQDLKKLQRRSLFTKAFSLLLAAFGILAVCLYFQPRFVGVNPDVQGWFRGQLVLLVFGVPFIALGFLFFATTGRWTRELISIRQEVAPVPMLVELEIVEDSESDSYYARVFPTVANDDQSTPWRALLWVTPRRFKELLGTRFPCNVYFHPTLKTPAIIEFERGTLFVAAGAGSCKPIPADRELDKGQSR